MPKIEQSPLYIIEKTKSGYTLKVIHRSLGYKHCETGEAMVRYERQWHPLYPKDNLKKFLKAKIRHKGKPIYLNGKLLEKMDLKELPFIKAWDQPIERYATFGFMGL